MAPAVTVTSSALALKVTVCKLVSSAKTEEGTVSTPLPIYAVRRAVHP